MKNQIKNYIIIALFIIITYGLMLINIFKPDNEISYSERRRLLQEPSFTLQSFISGDYFTAYEKYALDQFPFRDKIRGLKAFTSYYIFKQKDNNSLYIADGYINKIEYPLNEKAIINAANKINEVYNKYLQGMNVSYAIIPDKNYFLADKKGHLSMDYDKLIQVMNGNIMNMNYIDLFEQLTIDDYYKTDIHWRQDKLIELTEYLLRSMGNELSLTKDEFSKISLYPFYGSYYGQAALNIKADTLIYLTNEMIESALVYDHIDKTYSKIYNKDRFNTVDSYDIFLSGAKSLLTIYNPKALNNKELIIFRDSFGSSIAPLMLKGYSKITLVDLRYLSTDLLSNYIDFSTNQDVLFLYNIVILNNSYMLK